MGRVQRSSLGESRDTKYNFNDNYHGVFLLTMEIWLLVFIRCPDR